eukprot:Tbor_TRINITY_DN3261_c0_g1::TRINITY_DN3261_c0_g1_i1::g.23739::m.23739
MAATLNLDIDTIPRLKLESAMGFGGGVADGLHIHPDGKHMLYPLGACIVIREVGNPKCTGFLTGHNDKISCLAISRSGKYVASGQATHMGFQADICVFDFEARRMIHRMVLHKVNVQALAFSGDESFLASVGGKDDNTVVVWDLVTGRPICGGPCSTELTSAVAFFNNSCEKLITGGSNSLKVWEIDLRSRKINPEVANLGNMRRDIRTIVVEPLDRFAYCGTATGDVVCIQLQGPKNFKMGGPQQCLTDGIICTVLNDAGDILVGSGGGEVALLSKVDLKVLRRTKVDGGVTSVASMGGHLFVGTRRSNVYYINAKTFRSELRQTCHCSRISDVVFPYGYSELFATCGSNDIRVWNARTSAELLRIQVGTMECNCIQFTKNGNMIVSGWSDGKVRAFGPESGRLIYAINDAHKLTGMKRISGSHTGVTAVCVDNANERIVTGGADGQVRVWKIRGQCYQLEASLNEHKATINDICINSTDTECISACDDGSCILWDLQRHIRRNIMYSQTYFKAARYFVDESQLLTTGSDKKVSFWDAVECRAIRELEGSKIGEINALDISSDGTFFVTGGADRIVKLWGYDEGICSQIGLGHSCNITSLRIAPDMKTVVSVSDEGAVMVWRIEDLKVNSLV